MSKLTFKIASLPDEFEQIHLLNYRTFVEEIPQHDANAQGRLVDRFHDQNTYIVALDGKKVVGMICARNKRPFSLDQKLDNLDSFLPAHRSLYEVRLLAVEKTNRSTGLFLGLIHSIANYCESQGCDLVVMTGTTRQLKLYRSMGFEPFGPLVGTQAARFQPMYWTLAAYREFSERTKHLRINYWHA